MPTAEQVADIGLAPIRPGGGKETQAQFKKAQKLQQRISTRTAQGKPSEQAQAKLKNVQARLNAMKGPSYLNNT